MNTSFVAQGKPKSQTVFSQIRKAMKRIDLFSFQPIPQHNGGKMQTTPGLMVSLVVYALVISFMSISITRFVNGQPSTSQWSKPVTNATEQVLVVGWKFNKIADPRYFRVQLLYRTRTFNESTQKGKTVPRLCTTKVENRGARSSGSRSGSPSP